MRENISKEIVDEKLKYMYLAIEDAQIKLEKNNKRLWILCIFLIITLIATNAGWLYYEGQWEYTQKSTTISQDIDSGNGDTNIIGIGDIYGTDKAIGN